MTPWPWRHGLASQGQAVLPCLHSLCSIQAIDSCTGPLAGCGGAEVTSVPAPPCRSCTGARSSHPSSRLWHNPMTPSTLTLSSHPARPRVRPLSGLSWTGTGGKQESGASGHRGGQGCGRPRCVGRQVDGSLTPCLHLILPGRPTPGLYGPLCAWVRGVGVKAAAEKSGPLPWASSAPWKDETHQAHTHVRAKVSDPANT